MKSSIGDTLAKLRRENKLMQKDVAARLTALGYPVSAKTIYNWEKGLAQPGIPVFLALCDILGVDDVLWQFAGIHRGPYAGLNHAGRQKARELTDLLFHIDIFKESNMNSFESGEDAFESERESPDSRYVPLDAPRLLRLYDIPVSAGGGNFLNDSGYEMIQASDYVPPAADFALRISGDSMEPLFRDGQVIWVKEQDSLSSGEIGIFVYSDDVYCKKLIIGDGKAFLRSLNPKYADVGINESLGLKTIGKVVR